MLQEPVKFQKITVRASLRPPTTSWKLYYLYTGNISVAWIPHLNLVHQIARDREIYTH